MKGGVWGDTSRNELRAGIKARAPWCQGMHSSSKCTAGAQSSAEPCEKLGCEQPGGREGWNECVCWDFRALKRVQSVGLLQLSGYFTSVATLST